MNIDSSGMHMLSSPDWLPDQVQGGIRRTQLERVEFADGYVLNSSVVEVQAGVTAEPHTHPGYEIGYVLGGDATIVVAGRPDERVVSGDIYRIPSNAVHFARVGTKSPLHVVSVFIVDKAQPLATLTNTPHAAAELMGGYDVATSVQSFSSSEQTHIHTGIESGYVIDGKGSITVEGFADRLLGPGDSYTVPAGLKHNLSVTGSNPLNVFLTHVTPKPHPSAAG